MSTDFKITDEVRRIWQATQYLKLSNPITDSRLADFARDCLAAKMRAEWQQNHYPVVKFCCGPQTLKEEDFRHSWQWAEWQAEAERELSKS